MLMTAQHIKSTILAKEEARIGNTYTKNINYHGLEKTINYSLEIYKKSNNNYIIITEIKNNI